MLVRAFRVRQHLQQWVKIPQYQQYTALLPTAREWIQIEHCIKILQPFYTYTEAVSKARSPTIQDGFAIFDDLFDHVEDKIQELEGTRASWKVDLRDALHKLSVVLKKYYKNTELSGLIYNLACILDPAKKLSLHERWDRLEDKPIWVDHYRKEFISYFDTHYRQYMSESPTAGSSLPPPKASGKESYRQRLLRRTIANPNENELTRYLDTPPLKLSDDDPLIWWSQNANQYPALAKMAKRILAVPISSVGVERVFSVARDVLPYRRNRLSGGMIKTLLICKYADKGIWAAEEQSECQELVLVEDSNNTVDQEENGMGLGIIQDKQLLEQIGNGDCDLSVDAAEEGSY